MKILYGVQSTGNGHVSRSREVIDNLKTLGHEVRVVFSGSDPGRFATDPFFDPCEVFRGLTFSTSHGKLQYAKTMTQLNLIQFYRDIAGFDARGFDLVISDFEPLTSRIAARFSIPSIGIGHQYAFCYTIPVAGFNLLSRWVMRSFAPVDTPIGLHWHHFNQPILPPIVPFDLTCNNRPCEKKILVYLPFEELSDIEVLLSPFDSIEFFVYGIPSLREGIDRGNLHLRPYSREGFLADLTDCNGVISNSGFELTSEALQLGKKILVKPLQGQFEQESNALAVTRLKLGMTMAELCRKTLAAWLQQAPAPAPGYPDVAKLIANWIHSGDFRNVENLSSLAWSRAVNVPIWSESATGD